jgi:uncharacterized membrane protein YkgB
LGLLDILVILAVLVLLLWAGSHDFRRYEARSVETPTATATP